ncbi:hypothetical protein HHI36_002132, partial [Cryptolaemus montrouzieri]
MKCFNYSFPLKRSIKLKKNKKVIRNPKLERHKNSVDAAETIHRVRKDKSSKDIYSILRKQYKMTVDSEVRREYLEKIESSTDPHKT